VGKMNLSGAELRAAIDEAIAEIDRVEEEMLELMAELIGPDAAIQMASYARAQEERSALRSLAAAEDRTGRDAAHGGPPGTAGSPPSQD